MASVFAGSVQKGSPEVTLEMSLEINRKMQAVLEDTLIKNITIKVCYTHAQNTVCSVVILRVVE